MKPGAAAKPKAGAVHLWSQRSATPTRVAEAIDSDTKLVIHALEGGHPERADYYIVSSLDVNVEREAARLGALPVVLPEAREWLHLKIAERCARGEDVVIAMRWRS